MVTISTTSEDKTSNCVATPKKKQMASTTSNQTSSSSGTGNSTSSSSNNENNSDQMAPNILVYKKVSGMELLNIHGLYTLFLDIPSMDNGRKFHNYDKS